MTVPNSVVPIRDAPRNPAGIELVVGRASTISTADEIQSDPSTPMSTMYARSGVRLGIPYEAELRGVRPEIRTSGTRVFLGCTVLLIWVGGDVGRSSCGLLLVAGVLVGDYRPCDHGRTDSFFSLDLSVLASPYTWTRYSIRRNLAARVQNDGAASSFGPEQAETVLPQLVVAVDAKT